MLFSATSYDMEDEENSYSDEKRGLAKKLSGFNRYFKIKI